MRCTPSLQPCAFACASTNFRKTAERTSNKAHRDNNKPSSIMYYQDGIGKAFRSPRIEHARIYDFTQGKYVVRSTPGYDSHHMTSFKSASCHHSQNGS
eukprot:scaffold4723_cov172-Amphora_coffeaeformis.AAC.4